MLQRCYDIKLHNKYPTYKGCRVSDEWLSFGNFANWFDENYVEGWQIDKDILGDGKLYSPETCCFVPHKINNLLHDNKAKKRDSTPIGVKLQDSRYRVQIGNSRKHIGYFSTPQQAETAYKKAKKEYVMGEINKCLLQENIKTAILSAL